MSSAYAHVEDKVTAELIANAVDLVISNGIVMASKDKEDGLKTCIPAPFALMPTQFPKEIFHFLLSLQVPINKLMHDMSQDVEFMSSALKSVTDVDEFTMSLLEVYKSSLSVSKFSLGIFRSDYMLNCMTEASGKQHHEPKQVEVNTIAVGGAGIDSRMNKVHAAVLKEITPRTQRYDLPVNEAQRNVARGLVEGWKVYGKQNTVIVFVVIEGEENIFDQRALEYEIYALNENIIVRRKTFGDFHDEMKIASNKSLFILDEEVAVVYFRTGYSPEQYTTAKDWRLRLNIEQSMAIMCPSAAYQLAGCKKMQGVLAQPGALERFIKDVDIARKIRSTFTGLYTLEMNNDGDYAVKMALANPDDYVLKPQREGGGNNVYGKDIVNVLDEVGADNRRCAYILMDKIRPKSYQNTFISTKGTNKVNAVSEIGIIGVILARGDKVKLNYTAGHILRSKSDQDNDGGVGNGIAVIDSPLLV